MIQVEVAGRLKSSLCVFSNRLLCVYSATQEHMVTSFSSGWYQALGRRSLEGPSPVLLLVPAHRQGVDASWKSA